MKFLCLCLLGITVFVELLVLTLANPDGFLSINCGASKNETRDGLLWVSDSHFIKVKSRQNYTVSPPMKNEIYLQYQTLSYFKDESQNKYCYLLPVNPGIPYLVRTRFYARFASELSLATVFDLFIGGAKWATVNLVNGSYDYDSVFHHDITLASKTDDRLSLCLARNSETQPGHYVFISTIELRRLNSSMYTRATADFHKSALVGKKRVNFGGDNLFSYKSDPYDRLWFSYTPTRDVRVINVSYSLGKGLPNDVPQKVLQTAVFAKKIEDMTISNAFPSVHSGCYYFLFYFCNTNLTATAFKVLINNHEIAWIEFKHDLQCQYLDYHLKTFYSYNAIEVVLRPSQYSTSGPLINGGELYKILDVQNTHQEDVFAIREIAEAINVPDDWSGADPCLPSNYSSTGITCSQENPPRVIIIDLTNKGLVGKIPPSIANLTALTQLLLGNNNLSGPVPDLSHLKNLTKLYLQNNSLTGTLPQGLVKPGLDLRVDPQIKYPLHKRKNWPMEISVGFSVLLALVAICTAFIWRHRSQSRSYTKDCPTPKEQHASADIEGQSECCRLAIEYTEEEIKTATENYSKVIGKGSFGSVYYGRISGSDVAVKVRSTDSNQGQPEFQNELTLLSRIHHRNLVNLVGYCRQPVVALVYNYMECGSLKDHLYGVMENPLDWHTRLNIALQAAEGLLYLHHGCDPPIIHRDIKCSNILLDRNMCAKVADFGISKLVESSKSYVLTEVKGTMGYLDPEYFETWALTEKSDVYSFGVVLLEIISGVSPKDGIVESGRKLVSCGRLVDLIDPSLGGRYNLACAWRVADIAYGCTERKPIERPKMSEVVKELEAAAALPEEDVNRVENNSIITPSIEADLPTAR